MYPTGAPFGVGYACCPTVGSLRPLTAWLPTHTPSLHKATNNLLATYDPRLHIAADIPISEQLVEFLLSLIATKLRLYSVLLHLCPGTRVGRIFEYMCNKVNWVSTFMENILFTMLVEKKIPWSFNQAKEPPTNKLYLLNTVKGSPQKYSGLWAPSLMWPTVGLDSTCLSNLCYHFVLNKNSHDTWQSHVNLFQSWTGSQESVSTWLKPWPLGTRGPARLNLQGRIPNLFWWLP